MKAIKFAALLVTSTIALGAVSQTAVAQAKTREQVRQELVQAQHAGLVPTSKTHYPRATLWSRATRRRTRRQGTPARQHRRSTITTASRLAKAARLHKVRRPPGLKPLRSSRDQNDRWAGSIARRGKVNQNFVSSLGRLSTPQLPS